MPESILAIDLGTTTGWALRGLQGDITSGSIGFKPQPMEGDGMRYLRFRWFLGDIGQDVQFVYFEDVKRHLGTEAAHVYGGFKAHLTAWCEARKVCYRGVPVGTIKKHTTGKGNASKDEMICAAKMLGFNPKDDNEADALALLHYAMEKHK